MTTWKQYLHFKFLKPYCLKPALAQEVIDLLKLSEFNQYTNAVSKKDPLVEYLPYTKAEQVLVTGYETISTKIANQSNKLKILNIGAKTQSEQNLAIALVKELNKIMI